MCPPKTKKQRNKETKKQRETKETMEEGFIMFLNCSLKKRGLKKEEKRRFAPKMVMACRIDLLNVYTYIKGLQIVFPLFSVLFPVKVMGSKVKKINYKLVKLLMLTFFIGLWPIQANAESYIPFWDNIVAFFSNNDDVFKKIEASLYDNSKVPEEILCDLIIPPRNFVVEKLTKGSNVAGEGSRLSVSCKKRLEDSQKNTIEMAIYVNNRIANDIAEQFAKNIQKEQNEQKIIIQEFATIVRERTTGYSTLLINLSDDRNNILYLVAYTKRITTEQILEVLKETNFKKLKNILFSLLNTK